MSLWVSEEHLGRVPGVCLVNQVSELLPRPRPGHWGLLPGLGSCRGPRAARPGPGGTLSK